MKIVRHHFFGWLFVCLFVCLFGLVAPLHAFASATGQQNSLQTESTDNLGQPQSSPSSCGLANSISPLISRYALYAEMQKAAATMESDSLGRPRKFVLFGKVHEVIFDGDQLSGFLIDEKLVNLSVDGGSQFGELSTMFARDSNGQLESTFSIPKSFQRDSRLELPNETAYTADAAKAYLNKLQIARRSGVTKYGEQGPQYNATVPCFICEPIYSAEIGSCDLWTGLAAAADISAVTTLCVASLGTACAFAIPGGAIGLALLYNLNQVCKQRALERLIQCRNSCG